MTNTVHHHPFHFAFSLCSPGKSERCAICKSRHVDSTCTPPRLSPHLDLDLAGTECACVSDLVGAQAHSGKSSIVGGSPTTPPHWYWPPSHVTCIPFRCWRRYDRAYPRRPECSGLVITQVGPGLLDAGASPSWTSIFPAAPAQEKDTNTPRLRGGYPPHCTCLFPCLQGLG